MVFYSIKFRVSSLGTRFSLIEMTYEGFNVASSIRLFLHALAGCCLVGLSHPTEVNTLIFLESCSLLRTLLEPGSFSPRVWIPLLVTLRKDALWAQVYRRTMR